MWNVRWRKTGKEIQKMNEMDKTIDYYNRNAEKFAAGTLKVDFGKIQDLFLNKLPAGACILDFGCGAGRDTKYFMERGFQAEAIDGSGELCKIARGYTGNQVKHQLFQELDETEKYHGIWACASLLHVPGAELDSVFQKMEKALKKDGILYVSFKYGTFEGERNGRYFTDMTEDTLKELTEKIPNLVQEEQWITSDVRPGREDEKWLNIILRKQ